VDPAIHNSNTLQFRGRPLGLSSGGTCYELDEALVAVRRFVEERGALPTSASWTAAGMRPSEKTIRRKFGSFRAAVAASRLGHDPETARIEHGVPSTLEASLIAKAKANCSIDGNMSEPGEGSSE